MAPLEKAVSPTRSERSFPIELDGARHRDGSSSGSRNGRGSSTSSSGSSSTSYTSTSDSSGSSSNSCSSNNTSSSARGTVSGHNRDADLTVDPSETHLQKNNIEGKGFAGNGDINTTQAQATKVHTEAGDTANSPQPNGKVHPGNSRVRQSDASVSHVASSAQRRRLSGASVASVASGGGRDRQQPSRGLSMNTASAHVNARAGQRTGSTRVTTAGSRMEVRGELEIMNVCSAQEVIHLLEDSTSPFALQLQNVELRVGPSQIVRLGEAVPALREHLRRDLERQLQQGGRPGREGRPGVVPGERDSASRSGTSVSSSSRTSNIWLTGTVMASGDPRLFGGRVGAAVNAKTSAVPQAQVSARRRAADAEPVAARTLQAVSAAVASDIAAAQRTGVDAAAPAAVISSPRSAAVEEEAQQERASAEAASLVLQILEVQGQVKSLLAEEGISAGSLETAALKKKKDGLDGPEDEDRRASGREGSTRGGSGAEGETDNGREGQFGVGGSSNNGLNTSSSGSSGSSSSSSSRTFPKATITQKVAHLSQQDITGTAIVRDPLAARVAAADASRSSERPEEINITTERPSQVEDTEQGIVSKRRKSTEDAGGGSIKESIQAQQAEGKEIRRESGRRGPDESEERRGKGRSDTHPAEAKKETSAKTTSQIDAEEAQARDSLDREKDAEEISSAAYLERPGMDGKGDGEGVAEEKPQTNEEAQEGQDVRDGIQRAEANGAKGEMTRAKEAPAEGVHPAKEKLGRVERGSVVESKDDGVKPTESDENLSGTTAQKGAQPKRPGSGQTTAQRQKRAPTEGQPPLLASEEKPEGHPSSQVERATKDRVERPPEQKKAEEEEEGSSRAGGGETSSTEGKKHEQGEGVRSKKPGRRESAIGAEEASAVSVSAAPTFVQALSNFFSWGGVEEETKPPPVPSGDVEAKKTIIPEDTEVDREVTARPRELPVQVGATASMINEETGTSVAHEESRKKPRPKLQPKAPPARLAVSKRDKD